MDKVFRALADPVRRKLLDRLFERDGQTLQQLCRRIAMTRFGVMKHLRVLEGAGLVIPRKEGRTKLHFLNPVPIRLIHDRWTSRYAAPFTRALAALKQDLEGPMAKTDPRHVYEVYIRAQPEQVWEAMTSPKLTRRYFYDSVIECDWKVGSRFVYRAPDGSANLEGQVLEIDPPRRLVTTFHGLMDPEAAKDRPSRVTWTLEPRGEVTKITLVHDDFDAETRTYHVAGHGWNPVLSGLKTLLETGEPLVIGPAEAATRT